MKRRVVIIILICYAIAAGLIVFFSKETSHQVSIITVRRLTSQVITSEEETVSFYWYLSEMDSFLSSKDAIVNAQLLSEDNELDVAIQSIENLDVVQTYDNESYYAFRLDVDVSEYRQSNLEMTFEDAQLALRYENDAYFELAVGDVYLSFVPIERAFDIDFFRLKGVFVETDDVNELTGIDIGFDCITCDDLIIHEITAGIPSVIFSPESMDSPHEWAPQEGEMVRLSLNKTDAFLDLNRFALILTYSCHNELKRWVIDDFLFRSVNLILPKGAETIDKQVYTY